MVFKKYKLKDLGEIVTGKTPKKSNKEYYNSNDIMFIKPDDLFQDNILLLDKSKEYISKKGAETVRVLPKNSVLVTCIGTIGKVAILYSDKAAFNQQINAIIPNEKIIISKFLAYSIWFNRLKLHAIANAPIVPIINKTQFSEFEIQVPNIDYQKKVVNILDKASDLINKRKSQIEALDQLTQSVFLEMFGDPRSNPKNFNKVSLGELFEIKTGGTPSRNNKDYWNGDIPWVKTTEVNENVIIQTEEFISEEGLSNSNAVLLPANTLLIAMYGQGKTRGRTAKLGIEATTNQACAALLPNTEIEQDFIWKQLIIQYEELRSLGRGGNQPNLNLNLVRQFEVIVPPDSMQREFVGIIKKIDNTKNILKQSMEDLENMFNSLMQRAFKGELFIEEKVSNL